VATYAMPQVALRIPIGIWSDYLGRRKPLVIAGFCMVLLGPIGMGLAPNPWILGISRGVVGIGAATWAMFSVFLVSFYPADKTAQMVGVLNFINNAALVVATLGGGMIADAWGRQYSFFGAAVLAFIGMTVILFARESKTIRRTPVSLGDFKQVARRPLLIVVSIIGVLVFFVQYTGVWSFVPVYAGRLGASGTALGVLTMLSTAAAGIGAIAVIPLFRRRGHSFCIFLAALILAITSIAVPFTHSLAILDIIQAGNGFARGMLATQLMTLSILEAPPRLRATALSFYQAVYAIGMLSGPMVSGFLANNYGLSMAFYVSAGLCLVVLAMAYLPALPRRSKINASPEERA
jgi:MFS family permease